MVLLDKLRDIHAQPADGDLLDYLGIRPGDPFRWDKDALTVGDETVPMGAARLAMAGGSIPVGDEPKRTVTIGDL